MKKPSSETVPIRPKSGQEQYCNVQYHSFPQSLVLTAELFFFLAWNRYYYFSEGIRNPFRSAKYQSPLQHTLSVSGNS